MKKGILFLACGISTLMFTQCMQGPSRQELMTSNDSLQQLVVRKDSAMYAVMGAFSSIEDNLQAIKERENIIAMNLKGSEQAQSREEQINNDIQLIYKMMLDNREKISDLQDKLRKANVKNKEMQQMIASLESKIQEKDAEIMRLTQELESSNLKIEGLTSLVENLNASIDSLRNEDALKNATIEGQDEALNTAYYVIGSEKELKDMGVLDKKGNFAVGSKKARKDFDNSVFTRIDIREQTSFNLNGAKKAKVVTAHPLDSYTIYGQKPVDSLVVNNYYKFWGSSKYLVIVVN
ncbi:MAG: hypothetical protein J6X32_05325 [Salinivirgaceae bacterium]|nr:hypothetical protein [Salinivirgaceae bacterium]